MGDDAEGRPRPVAGDDVLEGRGQVGYRHHAALPDDSGIPRPHDHHLDLCEDLGHHEGPLGARRIALSA